MLETCLPLGDDLDASLAAAESRFGDLRPGHGKEILWHNKVGAKTPLAFVYVHGFSASKAEIRPIPDRLSRAFDANLYYTRLPGHGRNGRAMGETRTSQWYDCLDEALEIGRLIGERVILLSCSTGGTLVASGLSHAERRSAIAASVFIAPNFRVNSRLVNIAYLPGAHRWLERLVGPEYGFEPRNAQQAKWWTTSYPPSSIVPMMELVRDAKRANLSQIDVPALAVFSDADQVVDARATYKALARWGGPVEIASAPLGPNIDKLAHVIAGDIISPGNTDWAVKTICTWLESVL